MAAIQPSFNTKYLMHELLTSVPGWGFCALWPLCEVLCFMTYLPVLGDLAPHSI